jgi:hypothetical protein
MITAAYLIRVILVVALPLISPAKVTFAQDIKVPFLFTEDQQLEQTELMKGIPKLSELQADQFLNAPMTRLEYMLTKLESLISSRTERVRRAVAKGFAPHPKSDEAPLTIKSHARYARPFGRVVLAYEITELGRPNRPMRLTCDDVLTLLEETAPQGDFGYLYHNTALGVLFQDDAEKYTPSLTTLAHSFVYFVTLQSHSDDLIASHTLMCQRTSKGAPQNMNDTVFDSGGRKLIAAIYARKSTEQTSVSQKEA